MKKEKNGRKSLRRLKSTVGCNTSKRKEEGVLKIYVVFTKYIEVTEYGSSNVSCSSIAVTVTISIA